MVIKFEMMPKTRIAFVRQVGSYGPRNIQVMEALKKWAAEKNLLNESSILLGIAQENPESTPPEKCRYDACIVIPDDYRIDDTDNNIFETELAGGHYM
ncbi:DNA gyrase inhibitor GyrI [Paenibacillus sp. OAE614]